MLKKRVYAENIARIHSEMQGFSTVRSFRKVYVCTVIKQNLHGPSKRGEGKKKEKKRTCNTNALNRG
jgi:hypothetical protein